MVWPGRPGDKIRGFRWSGDDKQPPLLGQRRFFPSSSIPQKRGRDGTPVSRLSWFFAALGGIAGMTIVTIGNLPTAGCRRLSAAGRIVIQAYRRQRRPDPGEQYAQLGCLRLGDSKMQVVTGLSVELMDTLDDRQGLSGERQDMSAAIIRIRYALDEAGRLQPVEQANERNWPDVENLSEGGLIGPFVLRQLYEDSAPSESHAWEVGPQRAVVATASQPGCLEQQPHNHIWIIRARIILARDAGRAAEVCGSRWRTVVSSVRSGAGGLVSFGAELNFVAACMEPPSAFRIPTSLTVGSGRK